MKGTYRVQILFTCDAPGRVMYPNVAEAECTAFLPAIKGDTLQVTLAEGDINCLP